jgi:hypothetical protein
VKWISDPPRSSASPKAKGAGRAAPELDVSGRLRPRNHRQRQVVRDLRPDLDRVLAKHRPDREAPVRRKTVDRVRARRVDAERALRAARLDPRIAAAPAALTAPRNAYSSRKIGSIGLAACRPWNAISTERLPDFAARPNYRQGSHIPGCSGRRSRSTLPSVMLSSNVQRVPAARE